MKSLRPHRGLLLFSSEGRPSVRTSRLRSDRFSWLISKGARRARSVCPRRPAREDTPRPCVCVRARLHRARALCSRVRARVRERARHVCMCMRASWVWGQRLSGVIESCLQGAALRCSSRALPPGEGNHNAI